MKVRKLTIDYEYDFELYGVSTSLKDYKLAWLINNKLSFSLVRSEDYKVEFKEIQLEFVNYKFATEHVEFRLFKNKGIVETGNSPHYLVPEHKHYDYFFMVKGILYTFTSSELLNQLRHLTEVQLVNKIDTETLKSRDHFLY